MCSSPLLLPPRRPQLKQHVPEIERDRAGEAIRIGEVGEVLAGTGALLVAQHAHRRRAVGRVAREQVSAAGATRGEQAAAVGVAPLQLDCVLSVVRDHRPSALLLVPAECGHVVVAAQQKPRLARAGLGGEIAFPGNDSVRALLQPAGHRRDVPPRSARRRTGSARPSISNRITPGTSVRSASRTFRARRRTRRSCLASSSMLSAGRAASGRPRA